MPLDNRKIGHIQQLITRSFAGRQRNLVIVALVSGTYTYTQFPAIARVERTLNSQMFDAHNESVQQSIDLLLIVPHGTDFTGSVYIADTPTATALAVTSAPKYEIIEVLVSGIVPGGSHLRVFLRRLH